MSYEGGELSVSLHPEEWKHIAKLGNGKTYELRKSGGRFLLAREHDASGWAVDSGYLSPKVWYEASWMDHDENGEPEHRSSLFSTRAAAEREAEEYDDAVVKKVEGHGFGPQGASYWRSAFDGTPRDELAEDFAPIFYAKNHDYDGVWWDDKLDPLNHSAPRGLILQEKLPTWKIVDPDDKRSKKGRYQ